MWTREAANIAYCHKASNFGYRLIGGRVVAERCFAVNSLD